MSCASIFYNCAQNRLVNRTNGNNHNFQQYTCVHALEGREGERGGQHREGRGALVARIGFLEVLLGSVEVISRRLIRKGELLFERDARQGCLCRRGRPTQAPGSCMKRKKSGENYLAAQLRRALEYSCMVGARRVHVTMALCLRACMASWLTEPRSGKSGVMSSQKNGTYVLLALWVTTFFSSSSCPKCFSCANDGIDNIQQLEGDNARSNNVQ